MPTLTESQGIRYVMNLWGKEHNPPHIHAISDDFVAPFSIATGEIMDGYFPARGKRLVKEYIEFYRKELEEIWETGNYHRLPPLK